MTDDLWLQRRLIELKIGFIFLTRLPLAHNEPMAKGDLSRALWTAPVVGFAVALCWAPRSMPSRTACTCRRFRPRRSRSRRRSSLTGGLHEDGLADVADGFGGGGTRERKLEIMRDSRIGTYGVCALILSFILRIGALAISAIRRWWPRRWSPPMRPAAPASPRSCSSCRRRAPTA